MVEQISIPRDPDWPARVRARAHYNVSQYESCTQSIVAAFMEEFGIDDRLVLRAAGGMHGGMVSSLTTFWALAESGGGVNGARPSSPPSKTRIAACRSASAARSVFRAPR